MLTNPGELYSINSHGLYSWGKKWFRKPIKLNYKQGPQIVVKPENVWEIYPKKVYIGTSGYQYETWRGKGKNTFYPNNLNISKEFDHYSKKFDSVEINHTFYKVPSLKVWNNWYNRAPKDFKYSIKLNRAIANYKNLAEHKKQVNKFITGLDALGNTLGCLLVQYSSRFKNKPANLDKVEKLIKKIRSKKEKLDIGFEFRDKSWFVKDVYELMKRYKCSIVIVNVNNKSGWARWAGNLDLGFNPSLDSYVKTASFIYVRMHGSIGQYVGGYDNKTLVKLTNFLEPLKVKRVYIYFNNTDSFNKNSGLPDAIVDAKKMNKKLIL